MKLYSFFSTAAVVAAVVFGPSCESASAQNLFSGIRQKKSKKELINENIRLRSMLDSLLLEIDSFRDTAYVEEEYTDGGKSFSLLDGVSPETYSQEVTDSLLNLWYLHRQARTSDEGSYNMDSVKFTSNVPDKVFMERLAKMNSYITLPYNETVRNYIILYADKMPTKMAKMLALSRYYFPIFEQTLDRYGMPDELKYMAVIESALNPIAVSRAGAKGMWQFM